MEKNDNDQKIRKYKIKKWLVIILSIGVLILEILALCNVINMLWGCGLFIILYLLKKFF